jgi:hypothetical protein
MKNDTGKIIGLKHDELYSSEKNLAGESPVKYLIIEDHSEFYRVLPMFHGNCDNEKDYNGYTIKLPFIHFEQLENQIRALSIQSNKVLKIKKSYTRFLSDIQFNIVNIKTLVLLNEGKGGLPPRVRSIIKCFNKIVETNNKIDAILSPKKSVIEEILEYLKNLVPQPLDTPIYGMADTGDKISTIAIYETIEDFVNTVRNNSFRKEMIIGKVITFVFENDQYDWKWKFDPKEDEYFKGGEMIFLVDRKTSKIVSDIHLFKVENNSQLLVFQGVGKQFRDEIKPEDIYIAIIKG